MFELCNIDNAREHYKKTTPICGLSEADRKAFLPLPHHTFEACRYEYVKTNGYGKLTLDNAHTYSSSPMYANREIIVRISAHLAEPLDEVGEAISRHNREFGSERTDTVDWLTMLDQLIAKPGAWKNSAMRSEMSYEVRNYMDDQDKSGLWQALRLIGGLERLLFTAVGLRLPWGGEWMLLRMFKFELRRLLQKRKLLLLAILGFALLMGGAVSYLDYVTPQRTSFEAFVFATGLILPLLLPLLGGFATGDMLAEDRAMGLQSLIMSRGVSPRTYILAKALGGVVGQACFIAGLLVAVLLALMPFFPVGPIFQFSARYAEELAVANPLLYCLAVSAIYISAAVAFSGISLLISVWVRNSFVVMAAPLVLYIAALYALDPYSYLVAINPYFRLAIREVYAPGFTLLGAIVYWVLTAVVAYAAAVLAFSLKRDYA